MAKINEELVNSTCAQIRLEGHAVTVKRVMDRIGGNTNDVAPLVKQWKLDNPADNNTSDAQPEQPEQQDYEKIVLPELSEAFDNMQQLLESVVDRQLWKERRHAANVQRAMLDEKETAIANISKSHADVIAALSAEHAERLRECEVDNNELLDERTELRNANDEVTAEKMKLTEHLDVVTSERNKAKESNAYLAVQLANSSRHNDELTAEIATQKHNTEMLTEIIRQLQQAETKVISDRDNALAEVTRLRPFEAEAAAQKQRGDDLAVQVDTISQYNRELNKHIHETSQVLVQAKQHILHLETEAEAKDNQLDNIAQQLENAHDELYNVNNIVTTERNNAERAADKMQSVITAAQKEAVVLSAEITKLTTTIAKLENTAEQKDAAHQRELVAIRSEHKQLLDAFKQAIFEVKSAKAVDHEGSTSSRRP